MRLDPTYSTQIPQIIPLYAKKSIVTFQETMDYMLNHHSGDILLSKGLKNIDIEKPKDQFVRIKIADAGIEDMSPFHTENYDTAVSILNSIKLREKYIFKDHKNCNNYSGKVINHYFRW